MLAASFSQDNKTKTKQHKDLFQSPASAAACSWGAWRSLSNLCFILDCCSKITHVTKVFVQNISQNSIFDDCESLQRDRHVAWHLPLVPCLHFLHCLRAVGKPAWRVTDCCEKLMQCSYVTRLPGKSRGNAVHISAHTANQPDACLLPAAQRHRCLDTADGPQVMGAGTRTAGLMAYVNQRHASCQCKTAACPQQMQQLSSTRVKL